MADTFGEKLRREVAGGRADYEAAGERLTARLNERLDEGLPNIIPALTLSYTLKLKDLAREAAKRFEWTMNLDKYADSDLPFVFHHLKLISLDAIPEDERRYADDHGGIVAITRKLIKHRRLFYDNSIDVILSMRTDVVVKVGITLDDMKLDHVVHGNHRFINRFRPFSDVEKELCVHIHWDDAGRPFVEYGESWSDDPRTRGEF